MNRKDFLKTSLLLGGITLLPSFSKETILQDFSRNQLIGKGNPNIVGDSYLTKMHKETAEALNRMKAEALKSNINIEVVSAYRSFQRQKEIFEGKYVKFTSEGLSPMLAIEKIIEYSTIPGTSRHHWGTDLDLIDGNAPRPESVLVASNFHGTGPFCKMKEWMDEHAESFGFYEVYTNDANRKGFKYEPWHFSYAPVSKPMLQAYKKLDIKEILSEEKVKGSTHFSESFIQKYRTENILDINPKLL
ncbi:M15 family metallopeptidase [Aureisphaera sp. CAU 1614]|uniref:M15 family metallopeptidase n=1 Tax=Halomarinibacterium sedimenti TaxID=2857106 RepID=A0A9X1FMH8_9FLAO|nr:M15 family metallopeptidase [Halomarinibacterium sedimenti]MBW2936629.1 M15 family metallopeptidase [Halomarinibacterium sedimenti]